MNHEGVKSQLKSAKGWYWWLWLSPVVTVPFLIYLIFEEPLNPLLCSFLPCRTAYGYSRPAYVYTSLIAVLISALLHLILLIPALDKREFLRWHGLQMLALAAIRTLLALYLVINEYFIIVLPLIAVWLFGTALGQFQASRGRCTLRAIFGLKADWLSEQPARAEIKADEVERLVALVRFSQDEQKRQEAIKELQARGLAETF